ncbi:MAG: hypothetical protein EP332_13230 [Bacteroidetes bacterium]|nr:MAG: hypothetical protein EP332_13230 [Bacteroidota bacterium]
MQILVQNRMRIQVWAVLFILFSAKHSIQAQKPDNQTESSSFIQTYHKNHIYLNLLGDASLFSINYDRVWMLTESKNVNQFFSTKVGIGFNLCENANICTTIPHHLTYNIGGDNAQFEIGLGGTYLNGQISEYIVYPMIGLRLIPLKHPNFNFRFYGQLPTVQDNKYKTGILFFPYGISLGFSFSE